MVIDEAGNLYITGTFKGTVDFDSGTNTHELTSNGDSDIFVLKIDPNGNFIWAKSFGSVKDDSSFSLDVDYNGNVYTTGYFRETVDFDPGIGQFKLTSNGYINVFIQKLSTNGNFVWAKSFGGTYVDIALSIKVDATGNIYTTGAFSKTVDFDPGDGIYEKNSNGLDDIFVHKLDKDGNFIWVKTFGGTDLDIGRSITIDQSGNIYATGSFIGTIDFNPNSEVFELSSVGANDTFILKLDENGSLVWVKTFGGTSNDDGHYLLLDTEGSIYNIGNFSGTSDFDPSIDVYELTASGGIDIYIQKLSTDGNLVWAKSFGETGDKPNSNYGYSLGIDNSGNLYATGKFSGTVDFNPGNGVYNLSSKGKYDIFLQKLKVKETLANTKNILDKNFKVYPNPTNGNLSIDFGEVQAEIKVSISTLTGVLLLKEECFSTQFLKLSLFEPNGLYLLTLYVDGKKVVVPVIKQ